MMHTRLFSVFLLLALLPSLLCSQAPEAQKLPSSPEEVLRTARDFYDLETPGLHPIHLKAHYQLYDAYGKATVAGSWEYWWSPLKRDHSQWIRDGKQVDEWLKSDGSSYRTHADIPLHYAERNLPLFMLHPLAQELATEKSAEDKDRAHFRDELKFVPADKPEAACVLRYREVDIKGTLQVPKNTTPAELCFDLQHGALLMGESGGIRHNYLHILKTQGKFFARELDATVEKQMLFSVVVDSISTVSEEDPAFTPSAEAQPKSLPHREDAGVATGSLLKKVAPEYPVLAKMNGERGKVVLAAQIGTDGKIHDLESIFSPSRLLDEAARKAVQHWEYRPYLLDGQPVEVETLINVIFMLGN